VLVLLRWCAIVTPIVVTASWVRATSASSQDPAIAAGFAKALAKADFAGPQTPSPRFEAVPPASSPAPTDPATVAVPAEPLDPCTTQDVVQTTDRQVHETFSGPGSSYAVALTFDDGPSRENTPRVLEILAEHDIRATFFVLGNRAENMPDVLRQVDAAGHELANHGYSHASLRSLFHTQIRDEVCRTQQAVQESTGKRPALFRPPFGRYPESAVGILGALGYDFVLWDIDAEDWRFDDAAQMAKHVVDSAHSGSIILLHDRESITVHALPAIIDGLQHRGLKIVPISELTSLGPYQ
jgi:peptidoglycan/xylan/chitin deacetylase (PgdA/CDA1 family)